MHRGIIHIHIVGGNFRILRGKLLCNLPPEARALEHVSLVNYRKMTAAAHRITVCKLEYALDLVTVVDVSIKRSVASVQTALLAEVHTARQLADTEEFGSVNKFPFERALVHQR